MTPFPENYPEEYIIWIVHFLGRDFQVNPSVLIPRLETESLIKKARINIRENNIRIVVDIGSGSGIIGTSLADLVDTVIFLDISPDALEITEENFRTHFADKKSAFIVSDLLSNLSQSVLITPTDTILFVTNLPYIKDADWQNMSADTQFEPKIALFGGEKTGFELYETLFEELNTIANPFSCIFEFGFDQRHIAETVLERFPWEYSFFADYAGIERFGEIMHLDSDIPQ